MIDDSLRSELLRLMAEHLDGTIDDASHARLEALLAESSEARQLYIDHLDLVANLSWEHRQSQIKVDDLNLVPSAAEHPGETASSSSVTLVPSSHSPIVPPLPVLGFLGRTTAALGRPVFWATLAAGIVFAGYVVTISWNMLGKQLAQESGDRSPELGINAVATINNTADAKWSGTANRSEIRNQKSEITPGEPLQITAGLVELKLKQGTTLLIEGPAEWSIDGDNNATLTQGKLVAKVPKQAIGFTLETPTARIVDLGTEFGVDVSQDGAADVHVLNGLVDVQGVGGANQKPAQRLKAGQSARVTAAGSTVVHERDIADKFARLAAETAKKKTVRSEGDQYAKCVRALKPIVYLPIDRNDGLTIADHADGNYVGQFTRAEGPGDAWEKSPFGDALCFRGNKFADRVTLVPKDKSAAEHQLTFSRGKEPGLPFSIVLWARCRPNQTTGLLVGKGGGFQSQFVLDVLNGRYRFVLHNAAGETNGNINSQAVFDGTWQHVAAVFDPEGKSITLYVNGVSSAAATLTDASLPPITEPVTIGNRDFPNEPNKLSLDGALDEIAIFDRVLSGAEIRSLYRMQLMDQPSANRSQLQ